MLPQASKIDFISFTNVYGGKLRIRLDSIVGYGMGKPNLESGRVTLSIQLSSDNVSKQYIMKNIADCEKIFNALDDYFNFIN